MYFFAKRSFGEASARVALLAGAPSTVSVAVAAMLDRLGQRPFQPFPQLAAGRHQFTAIQARVFLAVFIVCWLAGFLAHYPRHPRARASKPFLPKTSRRHFQYASHGAICGPHLAPVQNEQNLLEQLLSFFRCHNLRLARAEPPSFKRTLHSVPTLQQFNFLISSCVHAVFFKFAPLLGP